MDDKKIVEILRTIFVKNGYETLFHYEQLQAVLWKEISADEGFKKLFSKLYESGATECIRKATKDVYHYAEQFAEAEKLLVASGVSAVNAKELTGVFYETFGFPTDKPLCNPQKIDEGDWVYVGEVKEGKRHGRGHEEYYYDGELCVSRDGVWYEEEIYGYLRSVDELKTVSYCFCINGEMKGAETHVYKDGEVLVDHY